MIWFIQATSKAVFKGLQELLKYLLQFVEEELQKDSEASIFSVFLILRLAFSIHLPPPKQKTGGSGLSFFSTLFGTDDAQDKTKSPQKEPIEMESVVGSNVEECDGGSKRESQEEKESASSLDLDPAEIHRMAQVKEESPLSNNSCDVANGDGDGSKEKPPSAPQDVGENAEQSVEFEDPLSNMTHNCLDGSPVRTIGSASSAFTVPGGETESTSNIRLPQRPSHSHTPFGRAAAPTPSIANQRPPLWPHPRGRSEKSQTES